MNWGETQVVRTSSEELMFQFSFYVILILRSHVPSINLMYNALATTPHILFTEVQKLRPDQATPQESHLDQNLPFARSLGPVIQTQTVHLCAFSI